MISIQREIITTASDFLTVRDTLESEGIKFISAEIEMIPSMYTALSEEQFEKMLEVLEDNDDVQDVYHNAELKD